MERFYVSYCYSCINAHAQTIHSSRWCTIAWIEMTTHCYFLVTIYYLLLTFVYSSGVYFMHPNERHACLMRQIYKIILIFRQLFQTEIHLIFLLIVLYFTFSSNITAVYGSCFYKSPWNLNASTRKQPAMNILTGLF